MAKDLNAVDIRKGNIKLAVSIWLRTILAAVMSFFVVTSITMLASAVFTRDIGYRLYRVDSEGNRTLVEEHYYEDESEEPSSDAPVSEGGTPVTGEETTTTTEQLYRETLRSEMSGGARVVQDVVCSILTLLLLAAFPYSVMWTQGDKDNNSVHFGHMAEDKLRGLKVGALAAIPSAIAYVLLILSKLGVLRPDYYMAYRLINMPFMLILDRLTGGTSLMTSEISWGAIVAMLMTVVFVPLLAHVGYWLGYKEISLVERFIYVNPNKKKRRRR